MTRRISQICPSLLKQTRTEIKASVHIQAGVSAAAISWSYNVCLLQFWNSLRITSDVLKHVQVSILRQKGTLKLTMKGLVRVENQSKG